MKTPHDIDAARFGARPDGSDSSAAVRLALIEARRMGAKRLVFPKGRYDFWPDLAGERQLFVSNNDEGLKRIAFDLTGFDGFEMDGQGSLFVFHDWMTPFVVEKSKQVTLRDFAIDWGRTFHSEGTIREAHPDGLTVEFGEAFPYKIQNGILVFTDRPDGKERPKPSRGNDIVYPYGSLLEFDPVRRETAFMARDHWAKRGIVAEDLGARRVRVRLEGLTGTVGNVMVFGPSHRDCPAIVLSDSAGVRVERVEIGHCGGMGIIAQRCRDLEIARVRISPPEGSGRVVSITADATHFSNCSGKLTLSHCFFELQKDDHTNIHGIYARMTRKLAADAVELRLVHPQQYGFDFAVAGARLELVHAPGMESYGEARVVSAERINKEYTHVRLDKALPAEWAEGDVVADLDAAPEVHIHHCTFRGNRARGLLLGSRGEMLIEENTFHIPGAAILLEGDACFWYEQSGVRDLTVRRNTFDECNFGVWGNACIQVASGIVPERRKGNRYHRGLVIAENLFRAFDPRLLNLYAVDGVRFEKNRVEKTSGYPCQKPEAPAFVTELCENVVIKD